MNWNLRRNIRVPTAPSFASTLPSQRIFLYINCSINVTTFLSPLCVCLISPVIFQRAFFIQQWSGSFFELQDLLCFSQIFSQKHVNSHFKMETEEMLSQIFDWHRLFLSLNNIMFSTLFCFLLGWVPPSGRVLNWCNTLQWSIASSCQKCLRGSCK